MKDISLWGLQIERHPDVPEDVFNRIACVIQEEYEQVREMGFKFHLALGAKVVPGALCPTGGKYEFAGMITIAADLPETAPASPDRVDGSLRGFIRHELGRAVHRRFLLDKRVDVEFMDRAYEDEHAPVSRYAMKDYGELFAESFVAYVANPKAKISRPLATLFDGETS